MVLVVVLVFGGGWYSSEVSARIYNEQNGTHYSASDFFWAANQINAQTQTIKLKQD